MKRIDIGKKDGYWAGEDERGNEVSRGDTKEEALRNTAGVAEAEAEPVTVNIHKEDGEIEEERTYPRSADPRSSNG